MSVRFNQETAILETMLKSQATRVESAVHSALKAFETNNLALAAAVIEDDNSIDIGEVRLEEECLKVMALHQPVAGDLRYVVTLLKVNAELERIGDLAAKIAEREIERNDIADENIVYPDFIEMFRAVRNMVKSALDSLITRNVELAMSVINDDDAVDDMNRENYQYAVSMIRKNVKSVESGLTVTSISRNLEHIADCATNICEDVIYLEQGKIIRHKK